MAPQMTRVIDGLVTVAIRKINPAAAWRPCPVALAKRCQPPRQCRDEVLLLKILLIEDDPETAENIVHALRQQGHEVEETRDGPGGLARARSGEHAALIVDRMLPGLDGLSLVRQLRAEGSLAPVLFLTTMNGLDDRVEGLEAGGDDYLAKPFAFAELLARVNAITRRRDAKDKSEPTRLRLADLEMDLIRRSVQRGGKTIEVQPQEFRLLEYFLRNAGKVVTRAMLLENVWDLHFDPRTNIVETHLSRLRSKVDRGFDVELIHTLRGVGYVLRAD
jgi:two-component system OmpR family response regulator